MSQRTRIVLMFFVIYLLCMLVSGRYIWLTSYQALTQQHHSQLERFAGHIQNKLDKFAHIPQLLAKDEPLIDALLQIRPRLASGVTEVPPVAAPEPS